MRNQTFFFLLIFVLAFGLLFMWLRLRDEASKAPLLADAPKNDASPTAENHPAAPELSGNVSDSAAESPRVATGAARPAEATASSAASSNVDAATMIAGHVRDVKGAPLENVLVRAEGAGLDLAEQTDASGTYQLKGLAPGTYAVSARLLNAYQLQDDVPAGATNVDFTLGQTGTLRGRVIDRGTGAVARGECGVVLTLGSRSLSVRDRKDLFKPGGGFVVPLSTFSLPDGRGAEMVNVNADGTFEFTDVPCGPVTAIACAPKALAIASITTDVPAGGVAQCVITLSSGREASGQVVDSTGAPVANVTFSCADLAIDWRDGLPLPATTDAEGNFLIENMPTESFVLVAQEREGTVGTLEIPAGDRALSGLLITLHRDGAVAGTITVDGGPPETRPLIAAGAGNAWIKTRTNEDGTYLLENLPAGRVNLYAYLQGTDEAGGSFLRKQVFIEEGQTAQMNFAFSSRGAFVEGKVTIAGQAALSGSVRLLIASPDAYCSFNGALDDNGAFRFGKVPAGEARLALDASDARGVFGRAALAFSVPQTGAIRKDVDIPAPGAVIGHANGFERSNFSVTLFSPETAPEANLSRGQLDLYEPAAIARERVDDSTGDFVLEGIPPGNYVVYVAPAGDSGYGGDAPMPTATARVTVRSEANSYVELTIR